MVIQLELLRLLFLFLFLFFILFFIFIDYWLLIIIDYYLVSNQKYCGNLIQDYDKNCAKILNDKIIVKEMKLSAHFGKFGLGRAGERRSLLQHPRNHRDHFRHHQYLQCRTRRRQFQPVRWIWLPTELSRYFARQDAESKGLWRIFDRSQ